MKVEESHRIRCCKIFSFSCQF